AVALAVEHTEGQAAEPRAVLPWRGFRIFRRRWFASADRAFAEQGTGIEVGRLVRRVTTERQGVPPGLFVEDVVLVQKIALAVERGVLGKVERQRPGGVVRQFRQAQHV